MAKSKLIAIAAAGLLALSTMTATAGKVIIPPVTHHNGANPTVVWIVFGCAGGIILAAWVANFQQNRQLTAGEAATCGLAFWFNPPPR